MIIRTLITLALAVPAFWLTMRFNMHMFQLNTYMNNEQSAWLAKNRHLQWILYFAIALGAVRMFVPLAGLDWLTAVTDVLVWITLIVIILVYRLLIEMNSKKPLKFTPRVKRMVATIITVNVLILLFCYATVLIRNGKIEAWNLAPLSGFLLAAVGLQLGENMLANSINRPIEKGVNNHYINDAKRILKENPDLTIIGVTGSYGKTSVKFYLETLLRQKYRVLVTPESYNTEELIPKKLDKTKTLELLNIHLGMIPQFIELSEEAIEPVLRAKCDELGVKLGDFLMILRVAVTGTKISPPIVGSIKLLGAEETEKRINKVINILKGEV